MLRLLTPRTRRLPLLPAALAWAALWSGCDDANKDVAPTVENIAEAPNRFLGERHTLLGEVDEIYSDRAFMLEERGEIIDDDEVLVVTRQPIQLTGTRLKDGMQVFVTGTVKELIVPELEKELGWDLESKLELTWKGRPIVVADSIDAMETFAHWSEKERPEGEFVSLWAFYVMPPSDALVGRTVDLQSADVVDRSEDALWIGLRDQRDMLVLPANGETPKDIAKGSTVHIKGTIKRVPEQGALPDGIDMGRDEQQALRAGALYLEATELSAQEASAQTGATSGTTPG